MDQIWVHQTGEEVDLYTFVGTGNFSNVNLTNNNPGEYEKLLKHDFFLLFSLGNYKRTTLGNAIRNKDATFEMRVLNGSVIGAQMKKR